MSRASPFQAVKTWKSSTDPDYEAKKNRELALYAIADRRKPPGEGDPDVVICVAEHAFCGRPRRSLCSRSATSFVVMLTS